MWPFNGQKELNSRRTRDDVLSVNTLADVRHHRLILLAKTCTCHSCRMHRQPTPLCSSSAARLRRQVLLPAASKPWAPLQSASGTSRAALHPDPVAVQGVDATGETAVGAVTITVAVTSSIAQVPAEDWDACAVDAAGGPGSHNPFLSHGFLRCLEESRSAVKVRPWLLSRLIPSQELPGTPHGAGAGPGAAALRIDGAALP